MLYFPELLAQVFIRVQLLLVSENGTFESFSLSSGLSVNRTVKRISYLFLALNEEHSPGIAQPSRNSIDRNMNPALDSFIALACAVPSNQFYLQVVQGVYVGEAVTDGALQGCVVGQQVLFTRDERQGAHGTMPFGFNGAKNLFPQFGVQHQF